MSHTISMFVVKMSNKMAESIVNTEKPCGICCNIVVFVGLFCRICCRIENPGRYSVSRSGK